MLKMKDEDDDLTFVLRFGLRARLGLEISEDELIRRFSKITGNEEAINLAGEAVRIGLRSEKLAEEVFARLEGVSSNQREYVRGIDAAARLGFKSGRNSPAISMFTKKVPLADSSSKRLLCLLRAGIMSGSAQVEEIENLINMKQLTLREKRLFWDVSTSAPDAISFPPLIPQRLEKSKFHTLNAGPHILINKKIYLPQWKMRFANSKEDLTPDAWLLLRGLENRGISAELRSL
jgi:hypothetical protein